MQNTLLLVGAVLAIAAGTWWLLTTTNDASKANSLSLSGDAAESNTEQPNSANPADPVATVNGTPISGAEFAQVEAQTLAAQEIDSGELDAATQQSLQTQILDSLINQELLVQAVANADISVSDEQVAEQLAQTQAQFPEPEAYQAALESQGITESELQAQIATEIATQTYLEETLNLSSLSVSEDDVNALYDEAAAQQELPPLEEIYEQVEEQVRQQVQQELIQQHLDELRAVAEIEVLL